MKKGRGGIHCNWQSLMNPIKGINWGKVWEWSALPVCACALLLEPALSVSAVANSVGFENNLYFSKVFRKRTGLSPSEYRARKGAAP